MAIGGVVMQFYARTAEATRDIGKLDNALGGLGKGAKKASGGIGSVLSGVGKAIPVVGAAVVGAAAGFTAMAKAAYDDQQAQAKLERNIRRVQGVTKKAAAATGAWIDQMELATLVSDDELRAALSKLTLVTGNLSQAQKLAKLSQDAAVGSGKQFTSVAGAMAKAAGGNTQALKRMFPELKAGSDGVLTMAEAMDQLTKKYGGAATAAAKTDVFARIGKAFQQIGEAIGSAALPLNDVSDWFSDKKNIANVQHWIGELQTWATTIGQDVAGKLKSFVKWLQSPEGHAAMKRFSDDVANIGKAWQWAATQLNDFLTGARAIAKWMKENPSFTRGDPKADPGKGWQGGPGGTSTASYKAPAGGMTVINVHNPKPEKASTSVAAALRVTRPNTVWV